MRKTIIYVILALIVVAAIVAVVMWRTQSPASSAEEEIRSAVVERGPMEVVITVSGHVEPGERVGLSFELPGRVADVAVEVGDRVEAGDVLASLDTERPTLQVKQAEANLASAQAQLAKLKAGPRAEEVEAAEANLEAADAQVSAAAANRDQLEGGPDEAQIASAEANLASSLTQQKKAKDWHDATMKCFDIDRTFTLPDGSVERINKTICPLLGIPEEQARYNLEAAEAGLEAARTSLEEVQAGANEDQIRALRANVSAAAAQRDATQAQLKLLLDGPTDEQIAAVEAQVEQARVALEQARLSLEQATLEAPLDGIVARVDLTTGEMAAGGLPVITLIDASGYRVSVSVDEMDVGQIEKGQTVEVEFDALPGVVVPGDITRIAPAAELSGGVVAYDVIITLSPTDEPIRADMTANATILIKELPDALKIPTWAVRVDRDTGQTYVHRQAGEKIERVDIELGARDEGIVQVLSGLTESDKIVRLPEAETFQFENP